MRLIVVVALLLLASGACRGQSSGSTTAASPDAAPALPLSPPPRAGEAEPGLRYLLVDGKATAESGDWDLVTLEWEAFAADGRHVADSTRGNPRQARLEEVWPGIREVVRKLEPGARARVWVPEPLASAREDLGRPAALIYDVRVVEVSKGPERPSPPPRLTAPEAGPRTRGGVRHELVEPGDGTPPEPSDLVEVHFVLWSASGELLDTSLRLGRPVAARLSGLDPVWQDALATLRPGGRGRYWVAWGGGATDSVLELWLLRIDHGASDGG